RAHQLARRGCPLAHDRHDVGGRDREPRAPVAVVVARGDQLLDQLVGLSVVRESSAQAHIMTPPPDARPPEPRNRTARAPPAPPRRTLPAAAPARLPPARRRTRPVPHPPGRPASADAPHPPTHRMRPGAAPSPPPISRSRPTHLKDW